jgi:hypothetical protein
VLQYGLYWALRVVQSNGGGRELHADSIGIGTGNRTRQLHGHRRLRGDLQWHDAHQLRRDARNEHRMWSAELHRRELGGNELLRRSRHVHGAGRGDLRRLQVCIELRLWK